MHISVPDGFRAAITCPPPPRYLVLSFELLKAKINLDYT
jgi:hypothetical protein